MVDRAALEMRWAARSRGFESLPLRHLAKPNGVNAERSKLTPSGNRGGSLTEAKGSEAPGRGREAPSESSAEQNCGPMNKNRLRGAKGGRAGQWPQSPSRSKPGSVESAVVQRSRDDLSQEVCAVKRRMPSIALAKEGLSLGASDGTANCSPRAVRAPAQPFSSSCALSARRFNGKCWGKK